jgi:hypothetical protein
LRHRNCARYNEFVAHYNEFICAAKRIARFFPWILFALFYQSTMPVAKRQAWTAQQKLYAIELKRKSPDKKLDDIIVAIKAKYDRDVSASTLHAWLKPESAAKIEQLVNTSGHNDAKRSSVLCAAQHCHTSQHYRVLCFGVNATPL